jgi:hypothetical protein
VRLYSARKSGSFSCVMSSLIAFPLLEDGPSRRRR